MSQTQLTVKDGNTQLQQLGAQQDASNFLTVEHTPAPLNASGVATPVSPTAPMPIINTAGVAASDGSGTISVGGTAQNLFGGIVPVNGYLVCNLDATHALFISDVGAASTAGASIQVAAGVTFMTPSGYKPPGAVSIYGGTTGQAFSARRW